MKKNLFILILLLITLSGCGNNDVNGAWEMNLDLVITNRKLSYKPVRIESLPLNVILEREGNIIYIFPAPYLSGGFSGKGYVKDGVFHFSSSAFEEFLFIDEIKMKALDIDFQGTGEISPNKDYITGALKGTLTLLTPDEERLSCTVEEGEFIMIKKGPE